MKTVKSVKIQYPLKQGLKPSIQITNSLTGFRQNSISTKTRIETRIPLLH
ncbi:hypothetical protein MPF_0717 [Methanohalophilus portucalensis FDF-1]|uniref:Uncharacterized protein n=1 Tax=Methanohalophilus portucalensis FDF-1 TaxID=523843 RepID=A0A1L9C633_9EURY|nr:hypothetical protein MPF_0717 [Methanohalophilus portucalensis FDF-1]